MYLKLLVIDLHFLTHKPPTPPPFFTPLFAFWGADAVWVEKSAASVRQTASQGGWGVGGQRLLPRLHKLLTRPRVEGQKMNLLCHTNRRMNKKCRW